MTAAVIWLLGYNRQLTTVIREAYGHTETERQRLTIFPEALYDYGRMAWVDNHLKAAENFLTRSVAGNPCHIDAWLLLARVESARGNRDKAEHIMVFTHRLTRHVLRWKWDQILLAGQLGREDIFLENINDVIPSRKFGRDALQLLDMYYQGDVHRVLSVTAPENRPFLLRWLISWNRIRDSRPVWDSIPVSVKRQDRLFETYVDFLVRQNDFRNAGRIWQAFTGISGMTNPGFEEELSGRGFDWVCRTSDPPCWLVNRRLAQSVEGYYALNITFDGLKNIHFHHLRQIVPIEPDREYLLSYWCKSRNLTTDQRPFIEIICPGREEKIRWSGDMLPETSDWHKETIRFKPPAPCQAVIVQLTRHPSHRFDSKISGNVWLDNFEMIPIK